MKHPKIPIIISSERAKKKFNKNLERLQGFEEVMRISMQNQSVSMQKVGEEIKQNGR